MAGPHRNSEIVCGDDNDEIIVCDTDERGAQAAAFPIQERRRLPILRPIIFAANQRERTGAIRRPPTVDEILHVVPSGTHRSRRGIEQGVFRRDTTGQHRQRQQQCGAGKAPPQVLERIICGSRQSAINGPTSNDRPPFGCRINPQRASCPTAIGYHPRTSGHPEKQDAERLHPVFLGQRHQIGSEAQVPRSVSVPPFLAICTRSIQAHSSCIPAILIDAG